MNFSPWHKLSCDINFPKFGTLAQGIIIERSSFGHGLHLSQLFQIKVFWHIISFGSFWDVTIKTNASHYAWKRIVASGKTQCASFSQQLMMTMFFQSIESLWILPPRWDENQQAFVESLASNTSYIDTTRSSNSSTLSKKICSINHNSLASIDESGRSDQW